MAVGAQAFGILATRWCPSAGLYPGGWRVPDRIVADALETALASVSMEAGSGRLIGGRVRKRSYIQERLPI